MHLSEQMKAAILFEAKRSIGELSKEACSDDSHGLISRSLASRYLTVANYYLEKDELTEAREALEASANTMLSFLVRRKLSDKRFCCVISWDVVEGIFASLAAGNAQTAGEMAVLAGKHSFLFHFESWHSLLLRVVSHVLVSPEEVTSETFEELKRSLANGQRSAIGFADTLKGILAGKSALIDSGLHQLHVGHKKDDRARERGFFHGPVSIPMIGLFRYSKSAGAISSLGFETNLIPPSILDVTKS